MTKKESMSKQAADLRKRSEEKVAKSMNSIGEMSDEDVKMLIHDMRVYQTELEMQNEALQKSHMELSALVNSISDEVWFAGTQKKFTLMNPSAIRDFNLGSVHEIDVEELTRDLEVYRPDGSPCPADEVPPLRALKGEVVINQEEIIRTPAHGEMRYRQVSSNPVRDAHGNIIGSVSVVRDITEHKLMEQTISESEAKYRIVADNTYDFEFWLNPQGQYIYASPSSKRITGYTPEDYSKDPDLRRKIIHPDDLSIFDQHVQESENKYRDAESEWRIIHADGSTRWISHACQPVFSDKGEYLGVRGSNRDITERMQVEEGLRDVQQRLEVIIDSIADGFYAIDREWRFTHANDAALRHMGKTSKEILGRTLFDAFPEARGSVIDNKYRSVMESGEPCHFENLSLVTGRMLKIHAYPGRDILTILFRDITDQNNMEGALRESEARFRLLSTTAGRLLSTDDPQSIVEDLCKDVMTQLDCQTFFNFLVDERAGRLRLNACAGIPDEDARAIEWLDYGIAVCGCVAQARHRIIAEDIFHTPDLRTELVKSYGIQAYCCHPLMAQDRLIGTLSFGTKTRPRFTPEEVELMRMVTDQVAVAMQRKQHEQKLQESKEYLERRVEERTQELMAASLYTRRLIETNLDPLVTISANGKVTDVNIATELVTGFSRSELLGSDFSDYFTEPKKARAGYEKVFEEGSVRDYPLAIRHRSGRITDVLYNASTYRNEEGDIQGVFAAARDVTELRQAQRELRKSYEELERRVEARTADLKEKTEQLEAANKELESFSYSVSHDLRAPLRAIDGYARMILKKEWGKFDEDTTRKFNAIRSNAQMMGQLIDDLLALSRLGKKQMSSSALDMDSIIMDVWKELQIINPERNMTLTIRNMPPGYGDRTLIKQVCSNLLANAVKFTKNQDAARIEAGGSTENDGNIYYVKDNGVGFDMAYYEKLFGLFQRLHSTDDFEGTGVGLATVHRIIQRHGGRVWAKGKVNEGATFYFSLPSSQTQDSLANKP
ncbi:MAG: PAS domain S-box protein [Syntrophaceae bacterium]